MFFASCLIVLATVFDNTAFAIEVDNSIFVRKQNAHEAPGAGMRMRKIWETIETVDSFTAQWVDEKGVFHSETNYFSCPGQKLKTNFNLSQAGISLTIPTDGCPKKKTRNQQQPAGQLLLIPVYIDK